MSEVNAAGTLISAVLETAGYVAQANILQDFAGLWKNGGALFYFFAAIGAVVSVALFGSYRAARYLLLGPALFLFLIDSRIDIGSVIWKLGGGTSRQVTDNFSTPRLDGYQPQGPINVSRFFYWYTTVISHFINGLTDVILTHENDQDLLMLPRRQVIDLIGQASVQKGRLAQIYNEALFGACSKMMESAVALASPRFSEANVEKLRLETEREKQSSLKQNNSQETGWFTRTYGRLLKTRVGLTKRLEAESETLVDPGFALREYIAEQTNIAQQSPGKGTDYSQTLASSQTKGDPKKFISDELSKLPLKCGQIRQITEDATLKDAEWFIKKIEESVLKPPLQDSPENRMMLCHNIAAKLYSKYEKNDNCSLAAAASVFMMRNAISTLPLNGLVAERKNRLLFLKGRNATLKQDVNPNKPIEDRLVNRRWDFNKVKYGFWNTVEGDQVLVQEIDGKWRPVSKLEEDGHADVLFGGSLLYQAARLKQEIFTFSLHIPYYQGVLLYLLSIVYPFMALLVLLPGRAQSFLYMPLFWLWVKSWDVGFALVTVLDKILWNLFPSTELPLLSGQVQNDGLLNSTLRAEDTLRAVLGVDPSYHVHAHYNFIAMALLAVPPITGFAILKAKGDILSSFTRAADEGASDAGGRGAHRAGMSLITERSQRLLNTMTTGVLDAGSAGMGVFGQGRGESAVSAMIGRSLAGMAGEFGKDPLSLQNLASSISAGADKGKDGAIGFLKSMLRYQAAHNVAYDPLLGRAGSATTKADSSAAAFDPDGGFEVNEYKNVASTLLTGEVDRLFAFFSLGVPAATDLVSGLLRAPIAISGLGTSLASPLIGAGGAFGLGWAYKDYKDTDIIKEFFTPEVNPIERMEKEKTIQNYPNSDRPSRNRNAALLP